MLDPIEARRESMTLPAAVRRIILIRWGEPKQGFWMDCRQPGSYPEPGFMVVDSNGDHLDDNRVYATCRDLVLRAIAGSFSERLGKEAETPKRGTIGNTTVELRGNTSGCLLAAKAL